MIQKLFNIPIERNKLFHALLSRGHTYAHQLLMCICVRGISIDCVPPWDLPVKKSSKCRHTVQDM